MRSPSLIALQDAVADALLRGSMSDTTWQKLQDALVSSNDLGDAGLEFYHRDGTPSASLVHYFPGGEPRLELDGDGSEDQIALVRGASAEDLVVLAVWANSVRRMGYGNPIGFIPYLPGARADHEEHPAGFDAAAFARLINACNLERLVCVDPHSLVMPDLLETCSIINAVDLVDVHLPADVRSELSGVIIPDTGARNRVSRVAERLGVPAFQAYKHRDFESGALSGFTCDPLPHDGVLLVVDDICDGGGTFRGIAQAADVGRDRLHLWVSHGVFSGRAPALIEDYSTITTTDSHPGCYNIPEARVVELLPHLLNRLDKGAPS